MLDLWTLQEAISETRPGLVVQTGTNRGGSAPFCASPLDLLGAGRVLTVDIRRQHELTHPRIEFVLGARSPRASWHGSPRRPRRPTAR